MRDYGKVHSTFWTSPTTHTMSDDGKLLALYLITGPHTTALGCFRLPDGYVAEDMGWGNERVAKGFRELFTKGYADRCETTKWVLIRSYLKWNPPENQNQIKNLRKLAAQVPQTSSVMGALQSILCEVCGPAEQQPLFNDLQNGSQTVSEPSRNQEQEQEQEQEQIQEQKQEQNISSEPSKGSEPARTPSGFAIPTNTGKTFVVFDEAIARWAELYPTVDVRHELRKMVGWCEANPQKRKTAKGMPAFINRWLADVHDKGKGTLKPLTDTARPTATERMRSRVGR